MLVFDVLGAAVLKCGVALAASPGCVPVVAFVAGTSGEALGVRFGSPLPASAERSWVAALRPSSVLSYLMPIVDSGSPSIHLFTSSTPCMRVWSVLETSYFH